MSIEEIKKDIEEIAALQREKLQAGAWWHSIDLGNGLITEGVHKIDELHDNYNRFKLPENLNGKRLLDIGCWDGFYSFESEKRGAEVVAIDSWRPDNFFKAREVLNSRVEFHEMSVFEISREQLGTFDIVLFLGVLYHLKHPLLALERICEVTTDFAVIETHVIDSVFETERPVLEFYEFDELGGQYDNWWGPNIECLTKMTRSAGFARVELLRREPTRATIKAHRKWDDKPAEVSGIIHIEEVFNAVSINNIFPNRGRQAFLAMIVSGLPESVQRWDVKVEIGGFGIHPIYVGHSGDAKHKGLTQINTPVPPGIDPGRTGVSLWYDGKLTPDVEIEFIEGSEW